MLLHEAAVECGVGGFGIVLLLGVIGGGTLQLGAGVDVAMVVEEVVVHHRRKLLPMVAKEDFGLQQ